MMYTGWGIFFMAANLVATRFADRYLTTESGDQGHKVTSVQNRQENVHQSGPQPDPTIPLQEIDPEHLRQCPHFDGEDSNRACAMETETLENRQKLGATLIR